MQDVVVRVQDIVFRVHGFGFWVHGRGFRWRVVYLPRWDLKHDSDLILRHEIFGSGFRVSDSRLRVSGYSFRV